jgi:hypothetical protein
MPLQPTSYWEQWEVATGLVLVSLVGAVFTAIYLWSVRTLRQRPHRRGSQGSSGPALGSRISAVRLIRVILLRPAQAGSAGDGTSSMARLTPWRPSARRSRSIARWSGRASCRETKKALIRTRDQQDNNRDQSPMRGNPEIHRRHFRCAFGVMPVIKAKGSISLAKS